MRTWKHKSLPWDAECRDDCKTVVTLWKCFGIGKQSNGIIPLELLENSNDWEEIIPQPEKARFQTEDGILKFTGDHYYTVSIDFRSIVRNQIPKDTSGLYIGKGKRFDNILNAEKALLSGSTK